MQSNASDDKRISEEKLVKSSEHYQNQYRKTFVDKWDELIDWEGRAKSEGTFFTDLLNEINARKVMDAAAGTGFHSVRLLQEGFDVLSVDGSDNMLEKAKENGKKYGMEIKGLHSDWRHLSENMGNEKVDAIVCLGNSFTHLFEHDDRIATLTEFNKVLKPGGLLILDQRNYDKILDKGYDCTGQYYYCGTDVCVQPIYVDDSLTRFSYKFSDNSEYFLNMFPLRRDYVRKIMRETGFGDIRTFGDFKENYEMASTDFFIHVARRLDD